VRTANSDGTSEKIIMNGNSIKPSVDGKNENNYKGTNLVIPKYVSNNLTAITSVVQEGFYLDKNIAGSLTLPDSITTIQAKGFSGVCYPFDSNTYTLSLPGTITNYGNETFSNCQFKQITFYNVDENYNFNPNSLTFHQWQTTGYINVVDSGRSAQYFLDICKAKGLLTN
jgi:hypothetical protein